MQTFFADFYGAMLKAEHTLKVWGKEVDAGRWQGVPTEGKPDLVTVEVINFQLEVPVDRPSHAFHESWALLDQLASEIKPNREWADEHFEERVGGVPLNPDPSHERWPHWHGQDDTTKADGKFTHTYSERFWPRYAGDAWVEDQDMAAESKTNVGLRFELGDYSDVLQMLVDEPGTRQAYLPIFFPEDTGAVHGGRIPCTLGYHFLIRNNCLHLWYDIRSCDIYRHMRDDIYLAVRLMLHAADHVSESRMESIRPGHLYFNAHSLHIHKGDWHHVYS